MDLQLILFSIMSDKRTVDRVVAATDRLIAVVERDFAPDLAKRAERSGSWAKNTEIVGGSDADVFVSVTSSASASLRELYRELYVWAQRRGLGPREQNVSIGVFWEGLKVDLVPGRRQQQWGDDHSLYVRRTRTWTKTNVAKHIALVGGSGRTAEIRLMKRWRQVRRLDIPSFLVELAVLEALRGKPKDALSDNTSTVLAYLATCFETARLVDPANSNNVVSESLSVAERRAVAAVAHRDLLYACGGNWGRVFS